MAGAGEAGRPADTLVQHEYYPVARTAAPAGQYTARTLSLACASSALLALLLGFLSGFCFLRRCGVGRRDNMNCGHAYLEAQVWTTSS